MTEKKFEGAAADIEITFLLQADVHQPKSEIFFAHRQWMYLEPIFTSEDISQQLPVESKKYNTMERTWRRIMKGAIDVPRVSLAAFSLKASIKMWEKN